MAGVMLFAAVAPGQQIPPAIKFASTPNPVGSGGRAVGWGGAFIAVADDATAASWNPAGLIQLETPEASVVLSCLDLRESARFEQSEAEVNSELASHLNLNYASIAYPFHLSRLNLVTSLNYQRLYEFDRNLEFKRTWTEPASASGPAYTISESNHKFEQKGALTTLTPALAVQITPKISLGASLNIWGLDPLGDGWDQQEQNQGTMTFARTGDIIQYELEHIEKYRLSGWNWEAGLLVKPGKFTIGAVYKAAFTADLDYREDLTTTQFSPNNPDFTKPPYRLPKSQRHYHDQIVWPASYGIGIAYRFSDAFSVAVDGYQTNWSAFRRKLEKDINNPDRREGGSVNLIAPNGGVVRDTTQVRAGMEYLIIKPKVVVALRGGAFYDPEPRPDKAVDFYGVSFGTGFGLGRFVADIAYQYRFGSNVPQEKVPPDQIQADVFDRFVIASLIYHFK